MFARVTLPVSSVKTRTMTCPSLPLLSAAVGNLGFGADDQTDAAAAQTGVGTSIRITNAANRCLFNLGIASPLSFMDAQSVAIWIHDDRCAASRRRDKRLDRERNLVLPEVLDRLPEIVHFQTDVRPIARRLQERFLPDRERVRPDLILEPEPLFELHGNRTRKPEHSLVKRARPRQVRRWIDDESELDDFHWGCPSKAKYPQARSSVFENVRGHSEWELAGSGRIRLRTAQRFRAGLFSWLQARALQERTQNLFRLEKLAGDFAGGQGVAGVVGVDLSHGFRDFG